MSDKTCPTCGQAVSIEERMSVTKFYVGVEQKQTIERVIKRLEAIVLPDAYSEPVLKEAIDELKKEFPILEEVTKDDV